MKNVLIIGANNALGHALLNIIIENGIRATAVIPFNSKNKTAVPDNSLITLTEYKFSELAGLKNNLKEYYDTMFFLDTKDAFYYAKSAAELAAKIDCTAFVAAGSQAELDPFASDPYGATTLAVGKLCEEICKKAGIRFSWLRMSNIYGPYDSEESFVSKNLMRLLSGSAAVKPSKDEEFDLINADEAAKVLFLTAKNPEAKSFYNVISDESRPAEDFIKDMVSIVRPGKQPDVDVFDEIKLYKNGIAAVSDFPISTSFTDSLLATVEWAKKMSDKNKKKEQLAIKIYNMAIEQYDSGESYDSINSFFRILDFKGPMYKETTNVLYKLFSEKNQDYYKENFDFNVGYFKAQKLADFYIEDDEHLQLYYVGDVIRVHNISDGIFWDLDITELGDRKPPSYFKVSTTYAGIIIDCDENFAQAISYAEKNYHNVDIYIMAESLPLLSVYMKLMKFSETELCIKKIFSSATEMQDYFRARSAVYLPKAIISKDKEFINKLTLRLEGISIERRGIENKNPENIIMTIAIPSYKRAKVLLKNIRYLLALKRDIEMEVYVAINGWQETYDADPESAEEIDKIKDSRLRILKREKNIEAGPNFIRTIAESRGKYAFICSDEDHINLDKFDYILQRLHDFRDTAVYRMCGIIYNANKPDWILKKGSQALMEFNFNTYITGAVYNTELLAKSGGVEKALYYYKRRNVFARWFTIPVLDMYMAVVGDVVSDSTIGYYDYDNQTPDRVAYANVGKLRIHARPKSRMAQYDYYTEILLDAAKALNYDFTAVSGAFINYTMRNFRLFNRVRKTVEKMPGGMDAVLIYILEYSLDKIDRFFKKEYLPIIGISGDSEEAEDVVKEFQKMTIKYAYDRIKDKEKYASYFQ